MMEGMTTYSSSGIYAERFATNRTYIHYFNRVRVFVDENDYVPGVGQLRPLWIVNGCPHWVHNVLIVRLGYAGGS